MASYHHKGISRIKAEELLLAAGRDGSFLVRDSETVQGAYTLCLLSGGVSKQYRILPGKNGLYVQAEEGVVNKSFGDLKQLIDSYIQRGDHNGLLCALKYPVPVESPESDDDEEDYLPSGNPPQTDNRISTLTFLKHFKDRSQQLDLSSVSGPFANALKQYSEDEILIDREQIFNGAEKAKNLQQVIAMACEDLEKQLNTFMTKIDLCKELFGPVSPQPQLKISSTVKQNGASISAEDTINHFYKRLTLCKTAVESLEKKAVTTLRSKLTPETSSESSVDTVDGASISSPTPPALPPCMAREGSRPKIPMKEYDVHLYKYGKAGSKLKVTVDVEQGKLYAVKEKGSQLDETNVFSSDQIQQLIKNNKDKCRLEVKIVDRKTRDNYLFTDARERESFCQHVKQMKMLHSQYTEVSLIKVFVGSWNMAENQVPPNLNPWLRCQGLGKSMELQEIPHDVYVIGTQETAGSDWVKQIKIHLSNNYGVDFHLVASETLWQIRIIVLVKPEYKDKISHVQTSNVPTGIANKLGNKGGAAVSFTFNGTGFCFVCSHLAARHDEKRNLKRHQNYRDIVKGLNLGPKNLNQVCDVTKRFQHVFFFGDLNYRVIDLEPEVIIGQVKCHKLEQLLQNDQLKTAQKSKLAFQGFKEDEILFPPTYRYQKGSRDQYAWEKVKKSGIRINAPSWCDRVLWKSYPDTHLECLAYGCVQDIVSSDHKPVFSSFEVGLESQALPPNDNSHSGSDTIIMFEELEAKVRSHGKEAFKLEFHSGCLEKVMLSHRNSKSADPTPGYNAPIWRKQDLPQLIPLFGTMEYLEGHHLIVAVKTDDGMESYGEGVISLKSKIGSLPVQFDCELTHQGETTGRLWGKVYISCKNYKRVPRAVRAYELVYVEDSATEEGKGDKVETYSEPVTPQDKKVSLRKPIRSGVEVNYSEPSMPPPIKSVTSRKTTGGHSVQGRPLYTEVNLESKRLSRMLKDAAWFDASADRDNTSESGDTSSKAATKSDVPTPSSALPPTPSALPPKSSAQPQNPSTLQSKSGVLRPQSSAQPTTKSSGLPPPCSVTKTGNTTVTKPEEHSDKEVEIKPALPPRRPNEDSGLPLGKKSTQKKCETAEASASVSPSKPADRTKHSHTDDTNNNSQTGEQSGSGLSQEKGAPTLVPRTKDIDKSKWPQSVIFPMEDNPLYNEKDATHAEDIVDYGPLDISSEDDAPSLPPRRKHQEPKNEQAYYDRLHAPLSVEDWLKGLQLKTYCDTFKKSGWDRIDYLEDMNKDDLRLMGITDPLLQQRILHSIADIKNQ